MAAQIFYPDQYNGAWCACPDPIDFRAYTVVDIYKDENAYWSGGPWLRAPRPALRNYLGHVKLTLEPSTQEVRGLAGLTLETATGRRLSLDRGPGGLSATRASSDGRLSEWTVLGASRGEAGILGEGVRQALLRDPTYKPALEVGRVLVG